MNNKLFRKDINGLRALAVIAVVFFHYNSAWLSGGFAGVDVFFVISGYLMTSIIINGVRNDNFSIAHFFKSRARRILPALITVILIILFSGYFLFDPLTYQLIGSHSESSLLFISNYTYRNEAGYFDLDSHSKFLLHTWSLSVEWQFYIIYPILLTIAAKFFSLKKIKFIILFLFFAFFIISLARSYTNPTASYFMLYSRAWEMLLGGLAFLFPISLMAKKNKIVKALGISLLCTSFFLINSNMAWPGYMAVLPTFGAYLCIMSNCDNYFLTNYITQKIGTLSYSIYLVHWPIIVFFNKLDQELGFITYIILNLILSITLYTLIERKRNYKYGLVLSFFLALIISHYVSLNGVASRLSSPDLTLSVGDFRNKYEGRVNIPDSKDVIYLNSNESNFEYILIGDSHAKHFYHGINIENKKVASFAVDGCFSTRDFHSYYNEGLCATKYKQLISFIKKHKGKKIIWSLYWDKAADFAKPNGSISKFNLRLEIEKFIDDIKNTNSKLFLIGSTPSANFIPYECVAKRELPLNKLTKNTVCDDEIKLNQAIEDNTLIKVSDNNHGVYYIDAKKSLCNNGYCSVIDNGNLIFTDKNHLTKYGSERVVKYIFNEIDSH